MFEQLMKIAHISDLHIDKLLKPQNYKKTSLLLEYIISEKPDHLVISGDITENADKPSFELARNLLEKFDLLKSEKLTIVPGNHDIFGGVFLAEDIINFPTKCRATDYNHKLSEFIWWFRETLSSESFPIVKEFDEFILIGLNSVAKYSILKNPLASNGKISFDQLKKMDEILKRINKLKIAVTHHHFSSCPVNDCHPNALWNKIEKQTMKLRKRKSVIKKFIEHGIQIVLHGHLHESVEYYKKGIQFINAEGSIMGDKNTCSVSFIETGETHKTWLKKINSLFNFERSNKPLPLFDEYGDPLSSVKKFSLN